MTVDVVVVGGGLSGLAVSTQLAIDGANVVMIEQANKLGGRAYSYVDKKTGDVVDNGQHVLVGAYHRTLQYLKNIGTRELLSLPENFHLHFHHPDNGFETFTFGSALFPINLAVAAFRFRILSLKDRRRFLKVGIQLRNWDEDLEQTLRRLTVAEWLQTMEQSNEAKRSFWYPIAISVMNESPEKASALLFARSLRSTFLGNASDAMILIPTVGQTKLYVDGAVRLFANHGSKVLLNSEAKSLTFHKNKATGVVLKNGKRIHAKSVICAVPHAALMRLLPETIRHIEPFDHLKKIHFSPIVSIHLWFDRPIMDRDFVGLIDRRIQWIFNRRKIMHQYGKPENHLSAIISGAYKYVDLPKEKLAKIAVDDIASVYPTARNAVLAHYVIIKEKRATFSPTNEVESFRPDQQSPIENLYLAGDWTNTGLPPTIEGAIMSGFRCAELVGKS